MNYAPARYVPQEPLRDSLRSPTGLLQRQQKPGQPVSWRLGDLLVADGLLTPAQLQKALGEQKGSVRTHSGRCVRLREWVKL